jgi:exopolyphosphatase/guanosine-5'-triphosphate,3'-diphosphate pyrophosphatase
MKRIAILDLGTNTFHLLIADIDEGLRPQIVHQETIAVKLGEGGISQGSIGSEAFQRGIDALKKFRISIDLYQPDHIKSAATSAIRSASNGDEFMAEARAETSIELEIIDGDKEAELIYQGVRAAVRINQSTLIIDIGGGSVEFIICDEHHILWKKSYPIGAARLMDRFHHSDPIAPDEVVKIKEYLDQTLSGLKTQLQIYKPELMIGSAGAFETFATLQDPDFIPTFEHPEFELNLEKFKTTAAILTHSTHQQRVNMPEITPVRVDMIVVATILTHYLLELSGIKQLRLSTYSLKEGILFSN